MYDIGMKISELMEKLDAFKAEHGDVEVTCDTQDGASYSPTSVEAVTWTSPKDGTETTTCELS